MTDVHIYCGPPCSGKTTLANKDAGKNKGVVLSMDEIAFSIFGDIHIGNNERNIVYKIIHGIVISNRDSRCNLILDATYAREESQSLVIEIMNDNKFNVEITEIYISPEDAVSRFLNRRGHKAKDLSAEKVKYLAETYPYGWSKK